MQYAVARNRPDRCASSSHTESVHARGGPSRDLSLFLEAQDQCPVRLPNPSMSKVFEGSGPSIACLVAKSGASRHAVLWLQCVPPQLNAPNEGNQIQAEIWHAAQR